MNEHTDIAHEYGEMINEAASSKKYRRACLIALVAAIVLAIGVAGLWWRLSTKSAVSVQSQAGGMTEMGEPSMQASPAGGAAATQTEVPLAPVQLTPQRMQSIGVQI